MSKHTPGPWIVDDRHIHPAKGMTYPPGQEPETDVILVVDTDQHRNGLLNDTDKANLKLAAASPKLFKALKDIDAHWEAGNFSRTPELWRQMKEAIADAA